MDAIDVTRHRGRFFHVLSTTKKSQTAVMTIEPHADAGPAEEHDADQIIYVIEGAATLTVGDETVTAGPGRVVTSPAHTRHHVRNDGAEALFCLTVYAPPEY